MSAEVLREAAEKARRDAELSRDGRLLPAPFLLMVADLFDREADFHEAVVEAGGRGFALDDEVVTIARFYLGSEVTA